MSSEQKQYHFIGIGGIGMSALAHILLESKMGVSGSDLAMSAVTEGLVEKGAVVAIGHRAESIQKGHVVVYSTSVQETNPELRRAGELECPVLHRSDLLATLMRGKETLAVAGTHGKTTTTALLAWVLLEAGLDPTFAIGGHLGLASGGCNGRLGQGRWFVAEADESDGSFLKYHPFGAIVTNVEPEHLSYYKSEEAMCAAYRQFLAQVEEWLFWCGDDPQLREMELHGVSYGFSTECALYLDHFVQKGWSITYDLSFEGRTYRDIVLPLVGRHNALNSAAVFGMGLRLGISEGVLRSAFARFPGVARRCQRVGEVGTLLLLDDYGHHPTEVAVTARAVREAVAPRRLLLYFQPHRYTRTLECRELFGSAFEAADHLFIADLYGAGETPIPGISHETLLSEVRKVSTVPVSHVPLEHAETFFAQFLRPHDVLLTMGAGSITAFGPRLLRHLQESGVKKRKIGILFGGKSCEHAISLLSARGVVEAFSPVATLVLFGITRAGEWVVGEAAARLLRGEEVRGGPPPVEALQEMEAIFPVLHGPYGEDGRIQGMLEWLGVPYLGPDFRSAALCMDKALTKEIARAHGVATPDFVALDRWEWEQGTQREALAALRLPLFVKPVHLGSSIGVTKVEQREELPRAIEEAFRFDTRLLIEEGIAPCREVEFALLGDPAEGTLQVPDPGEVLTHGLVYDYERKYGLDALDVTVRPELTSAQLVKGKELAKCVYKALGCSGMARVDLFLDKEGEFWLNEVNPIPGFTPISLYPKVWQREGWSLTQLLDHLTLLALQRARGESRKRRE